MIKKRESFIDVLRGIGILLVIIGHCKCPGLILKLIQSFHMPLFFIISGYLFTIKEESYVSYIKRIFKRYIVPYGILGAINYFLYLFYLYITNSNINLRALAHRYLKGLVYSRGTWYL